MSDQVRINGNMYGWSSIYFKVGSERYYGIKSIGYGDSRSRGKAYGQGRHHAPRGRTAGKYEVDPVTVTVEKATAKALRAAAAAASSDGKSFGNTPMQIVVQYVEGSESITDSIDDCVISKQSAKNEEGPDALYEDLEFDAMRIRWNGQTLYDASEGAP